MSSRAIPVYPAFLKYPVSLQAEKSVGESFTSRLLLHLNRLSLENKGLCASNIDPIIERLNRIASYDFENSDCLKFLTLIHEFDPDSYKKILSSLDIKQIKKNWENMSGHSKKDKQAQKYFDQLVLLVQQNEAY